jgi:hypothetical protein
MKISKFVVYYRAAGDSIARYSGRTAMNQGGFSIFGLILRTIDPFSMISPIKGFMSAIIRVDDNDP